MEHSSSSPFDRTIKSPQTFKTQKAVFPKPVERQDVSLVLKVFCYETIAALEIHPDVDKEDAKGTIQFLKIILGWWKIVNKKNKRTVQR